jgi:hypothetical protein
MSYDMKFKSGPLAGTRLEIARSKAATQLADGTPIRELGDVQLNETQLSGVDVHERQAYPTGECFLNMDENGDEFYDFHWMLGPTIAQQWRAEYQAYRTQRGWTARYYREGGHR